MGQQIRDVMTEEVKTLAPDRPVTEAAKAMRDGNFGSMPIARDDRLVGVVTDRDIVTRMVASGLDPDSTTVESVMSDGILYCYEDQDISEVAGNMGEKQVRRMPVVNRDKKLVGIVSLGDLALNGSDKTVGDALEEISRPAG